MNDRLVEAIFRAIKSEPASAGDRWRNTAAPKHHRSEGVTSPSWSSATLLKSSLNYLSI
jgi:hypothetical protein